MNLTKEILAGKAIITGKAIKELQGF